MSAFSRVKSGTYRFTVRSTYGTEVDPGSWYSFVSTWPWSQVGYNNPSWKSQVEARQDASSVYTTSGGKFKVKSVRDLTGSYTNTVAGVKKARLSWAYDTGRPEFQNPVFLSDNARNMAVSRFYHKLHNAYQAFDGLNFIGELTQTRRMIAERAGDLVGLILRDHKRAMQLASRVRGRDRKKKVYSRSYLEATFGWLPLFGDLSDLSKAFEHDVQPTIVIRSSETEIGSKDISVLQTGVGIFDFDKCTTKTEQVKYSFVAGIRPEWNRPDAFGFDLKNVPLAAWELTPWSFVVDYFVDIQGWLTSMVYSAIKPIYSVESVLQQYLVDVQEQLNHTRGSASRNYQAGSTLSNRTTTYRFNRYVLGELPQMKGPTIRGLPSAKQLLNLTALYSARSQFSNF